MAAVALSAWMLQCGNESFSAGGEDGASDGSIAGDVRLSDGASSDGPTLDADVDGAFVFDDPCTDAGAHTFCCDFDTDAGIGCLTGFQNRNGAITTSTNFASSPPNALRSNAEGDAGYANGRMTLVGIQAATCTFDLFIDKLNGAGHNIFALSVNGDDSMGVVSVIDPEGDGGSAMLRFFGPQSTGPGFVPGLLELPFRKWVRLRMDMTLPSSGDATASVSLLSSDGGSPLRMTTNIAFITVFGISVGFNFVGTGNGDAYIDNIVCDSN